MKNYKYRALVKLASDTSARDTDPAFPRMGGRVVVRAHHHETHHPKMFRALINAAGGESLRPADHSIQLTLTVVGDDGRDYLEPGDTFVLWRGHDIAQGVISRRLFLWADAP